MCTEVFRLSLAVFSVGKLSADDHPLEYFSETANLLFSNSAAVLDESPLICCVFLCCAWVKFVCRYCVYMC